MMIVIMIIIMIIVIIISMIIMIIYKYFSAQHMSMFGRVIMVGNLACYNQVQVSIAIKVI